MAGDLIPTVYYGMIPLIIPAILAAVSGSGTCASTKQAVAANRAQKFRYMCLTFCNQTLIEKNFAGP
jgi:hypothetical protein